MPWKPDRGSPEERERVLTQIRTLARDGRSALVRLASAFRSLIRSRTETRKLLSGDVYRVPDELLDDVVRVRMKDLDGPEREDRP